MLFGGTTRASATHAFWIETYGERIRSSHLGSSDQHLPDRLFGITTQSTNRKRVN